MDIFLYLQIFWESHFLLYDNKKKDVVSLEVSWCAYFSCSLIGHLQSRANTISQSLSLKRHHKITYSGNIKFEKNHATYCVAATSHVAHWLLKNFSLRGFWDRGSHEIFLPVPDEFHALCSFSGWNAAPVWWREKMTKMTDRRSQIWMASRGLPKWFQASFSPSLANKVFFMFCCVRRGRLKIMIMHYMNVWSFLVPLNRV